MVSSKSPKRVLQEALAVGQEALPRYAHRYAPKKFTQPQLFACLVLKEHQKKDYRGVVALLADSDLHRVIDLKHIPHFTTLQKAAGRLLKRRPVRHLLDRTVRRVRHSRQVHYAAGDSSGLESRHASHYYVLRRDNQKDPDEQKNQKRPKKRVSYQRFAKLMVIVCCTTHAILGAVASEGPTPDIDQLAGVLAEVSPAVKLRHLVLDAGFDSASNHRLLREDHGILSTIPPEHGRPPKDPAALPKDPHRRLMKRRFKNGSPRSYRQRAQVETVFSMLKRNLGAELRARSNRSRRRELELRVLTHNIMLALLRVFYRALMTPFSRMALTPL